MDDTIGYLVPVSPQGLVQFLEFRPQGFIHTNPWSPNPDRRMPLPGVTIRLQTVPSQQAQPKPPGPHIRQRETDLDGLGLLLSNAKPFSDSLPGIFGGNAFARCCWRPLWNSSGIEAPATVPPTGSVWARPGDEDEWTGIIKRANRSRRCGPILSTRDFNRDSCRLPVSIDHV